jgi:hypothetical protein
VPPGFAEALQALVAVPVHAAGEADAFLAELAGPGANVRFQEIVAPNNWQNISE